METTRTDSQGVTRRDFVRAGAFTAAGLALAPGVAPAMVRRPEQDVLRVGLVGCGGRGTGAAVQALKADPGAVLWAMADVFPERIDSSLGRITEATKDLASRSEYEKIQVAPERRFVGFDAYQRLIDSGCDVVCLATPPVFRPRHLRACVKAERHVFCEKPMAVDGPGVRSVLESAKLAKVRELCLVSGFCWRYQDQAVAAMEEVLGGRIGEVTSVYTTYNTTGWVGNHARKPDWSDTEFQLRNWHYFTPISGDHIVEQAVHAIDWIAWANGDAMPVRAHACGGRMTRGDAPESGNVWDNFAVTYWYENGSMGHHMCRHWPNSVYDNSGWIHGTDGRLRFMPWSGNKHEITGKRPWKCDVPANDMYQREHDLLFAAIRSGEPINEGDRMARVTLMGIMGRMAAYTGKDVTWEQALNSELDLNAQPWAWGERETPEIAVPGKTELL